MQYISISSRYKLKKHFWSYVINKFYKENSVPSFEDVFETQHSSIFFHFKMKCLHLGFGFVVLCICSPSLHILHNHFDTWRSNQVLLRSVLRVQHIFHGINFPSTLVSCNSGLGLFILFKCKEHAQRRFPKKHRELWKKCFVFFFFLMTGHVLKALFGKIKREKARKVYLGENRCPH